MTKYEKMLIETMRLTEIDLHRRYKESTGAVLEEYKLELHTRNAENESTYLKTKTGR